MGWRLARWWRRGAAPPGKHVRATPVVSVPADSTLVSSIPFDPQVLDALPATMSPAPAVGLVFSDGASVELDADDPRVHTFRAAASALTEPPAP